MKEEDRTSKQLTLQKYIYKIHSGRLRRAKWNLTLPLAEARRNDEIVSLADSQVLRWIDELNGAVGIEDRAREIRAEIRRLRMEPNSAPSKRRIRQLYNELDRIQFKPDYMCLIMDKNKDYIRACRGFTINGIRYVRLLGTNGGIKNSTIVFVSERLAPELIRRIENGRQQDTPLVPAKLEAYKALTCSASIPVSMPKGILVVADCETAFHSDVISLNDEGDGEPVMEYRKDELVELDDSDGYGLMLPTLAERWSNDLQLPYTTCGVNIRCSWTKGMVFTFDFVEFAERVADSYIVKDAWGNDVDIRCVELVLTTSMLKLWDSYDSCAAYLQNCVENKYTFGVTKTCPQELENERSTNYQFLQSYDLTDEDIVELISPTVKEIQDVLSDDRMSAVLFLRGMGLNEENVADLQNDFIKAFMIEQDVYEDPYVKRMVYDLIKHRIERAKVGVIKVHGNYSIICGDPYALCQSMFALPVTGLLKAGEIYNQYWRDSGAETLACFRAPMTCANNIRKVSVCRSEEACYWYRHLTTCTLLNAWDTAAHALNGADKDGDMVMLTDNHVLVGKLVPSPALMCAQRRAEKRVVTEDDLIQSNISSFGDDIGKTTNWITSMFEVQSHFDKGSVEYETLAYRIRCGQLFQQNVIDKAKGIIAKPMPRYWHDRHAVNLIEDDEARAFNRSIVADKKPYFMKYIYPALSKEYATYTKNIKKNALREFRMTVEELLAVPEAEQTERQKDFLRYYKANIPVGIGPCVVNRICWRFEDQFDGFLRKHGSRHQFDYNVLKSGCAYSRSQLNAVQKLSEEFSKKYKSFTIFAKTEHLPKYALADYLDDLLSWMRAECDKICPNRYVLCDIVLDVSYRKAATRSFAWKLCGDEIILNLLSRNGGVITFPTMDADGDKVYAGRRFSINRIRLGVDK